MAPTVSIESAALAVYAKQLHLLLLLCPTATFATAAAAVKSVLLQPQHSPGRLLLPAAA
jgi:hypothetical protein